MMKEIEMMSDHELLMELVAEKRRNDRIRYIKYGLYGVIVLLLAALCFIYVPKIIDFYNKFNKVMDQLSEATNSVRRVSDSISTETIESFNSVVEAIKSLLGRFGIN